MTGGVGRDTCRREGSGLRRNSLQLLRHLPLIKDASAMRGRHEDRFVCFASNASGSGRSRVTYETYAN